MDSLDQLARLEIASSAVAFRKHVYGDGDRLELLRDLLGLANAQVNGPRYIFLGVDDAGGSDREIIGISDAAHAGVHGLCTHVVNNFLDPPLPVRVEEITIDGKKIVAIVLSDCSSQPYLLKTNASASMRQGAGWVREGSRYRRLVRADFQRIYEDKLSSKVAGGKIRRMLEAKQATQHAQGDEVSRIQRLVHAQVFGPNEVYRPNSTTTLVERLDRTADEFEGADRHYAYEERAHKLNLTLQNLGDGAFEGGTLMLELSRVEGVEVADQIWSSPDDSQPVPDGYPDLDIGPQAVSIEVPVGLIQAGGQIRVFRQPLRLCLREAAAHKTIQVKYCVQGESLRAALSGCLEIRVIDDQAGTRPSLAGGA